MSLPPHILRIKRKRGDDPVESLYFEPQQSASKRRVTTSDAEFVFRRLVEKPHSASLLQSPSDLQPRSSNGTPQVIATAPGEEKNFFQRRQNPVSKIDDTRHASEKSSPSSTTLPRRFHLTRQPISNPVQISRGKKQRSLQNEINVAVFVETPSNQHLESIPTGTNGNNQGPLDISAEPPQSLTPAPSPRKRPRTPATGSLPVTPVRQSTDEGSSEMHLALQRYAAEEFGNVQPSSGNPRVGKIEHLKYPDTEGNGDMMDVVADQTKTPRHDEDYIYDTYVRYINTLDMPASKDKESMVERGNETFAHAVTPPHGGSIGYLIIPEADQTLWETYYASDASSGSEKDWDSEEDDENHENYYGADYPEDEVSSDDDRDENPYRYAMGSGDEESESEDEAWSDDGEDERPPWDSRGPQRGDWL